MEHLLSKDNAGLIAKNPYPSSVATQRDFSLTHTATPGSFSPCSDLGIRIPPPCGSTLS